jgi:hypothetical protein
MIKTGMFGLDLINSPLQIKDPFSISNFAISPRTFANDLQRIIVFKAPALPHGAKGKEFGSFAAAFLIANLRLSLLMITDT